MSWDVYLHDDRGHCEGEWNYTHNTNGMIHLALQRAAWPMEFVEGSGAARYKADRIAQGMSCGKLVTPGEPLAWRTCATSCCDLSWWQVLDGLDGPEGAKMLHAIVTEMEADPATFQAMDPPNGWGSYVTLLLVLREMRAAVPEWPCVWSAHG